MRKIFLLIISAVLLFSSGKELNTKIPPAKNIIIDIDPYECSHSCLEEYLKKGFIFSFLAKAKNEDFKEEYIVYAREINLENPKSNSEGFELANEEEPYDYEKRGAYVKIALLVPQKVIGKYAVSVTNSVLAYLLYKNGDFDMEIFNCETEEEENILSSLKEIKEKGYQYVIAPVTDRGAETIFQNERDLTVYIPTVNKQNISFATASNINFGGIDYKKQIDKLSSYINDKIVVFKDQSPASNRISNYLKEKFEDFIVYEPVIAGKNINYASIIRGHFASLQDSSVFLNTPLIKTSLILSQLRLYKIKPYALLSTQINYHPLLLTLTQYGDRKNLLLANSIHNKNFVLTDINKILDNNILFDWINYSTSIGMDFIYTSYIDQNDYPIFEEKLIDNQINYSVSIVKPGLSEFIEIEDENSSF